MSKTRHLEAIKSGHLEGKLYHMVQVRLLRLVPGLSWPQSTAVIWSVLCIPSPEEMGPKGPSQASRLGRNRMGWIFCSFHENYLYLSFQPQLG